MGLLGFWKKKDASDLPLADQPPDQDTSELSDLPPIDPATIDGSSMEKMPTFDDSSTDTGPKSMSVNLPTLDFSMPPPDDLPEGTDAENLKNRSAFNPRGDLRGTSNETLGELPKLEPFDNQAPKSNLIGAVDPNDLNKLFISDGWKEPDWKDYEPYQTEKIEEPAPEDFTGSSLPEFDDAAVSATPLGKFNQDADYIDEDSSADEPPAFMPMSDAPLDEPGEEFKERSEAMVRPLELYIKGKAYGKVFSELEQMSKSLSKMDSLASNYEDVLKQEEPLLNSAKELMEYTYRRLSQIDKKIFVQ